MAYRRSICTRATLLARRINPCFGCVSHDHHDKHHEEPGRPQINDFVTQRRSFGIYKNFSQTPSSSFFYKRSIFPASAFNGVHFHRHMSTSIGEGSDKVEYLSDVAGVIADAPVKAVASPVMSEVAVAAADSFWPVAALQYVIDGVHTFTGLNWWASIVLTTLLIRGITLPFLINQLKATSKLSIMRPRLEEIKEEMESKGMDPQAIADGRQRMNQLFKEYGVTPFTPLKGLFIQGPVFVSFFLAISNMVEKVPSFKNGGAFWFTDLTVPDSTYIFPVLTALTFLLNVEFNTQEGLEGNPVAGTIKKFSRGLAVLTVPFTMQFPQAIFCYWITSNVFSFAYGSVLKIPSVKNALGVPEIPVQPPTPTGTRNSQSSFSLIQVLKQASLAAQKTAESFGNSELQKPADPKSSSSTALSQRLRSLERQVKQKKRNKRR